MLVQLISVVHAFQEVNLTLSELTLNFNLFIHIISKNDMTIPLVDKVESGYRQTFDGHTIVGNQIVDHSDVVGALPVGAAPTTSPLST